MKKLIILNTTILNSHNFHPNKAVVLDGGGGMVLRNNELVFGIKETTSKFWIIEK